MSRVKQVLLLLGIACGVCLRTITAVPAVTGVCDDAKNEEDCLDRIAHPNLGGTQSSVGRTLVGEITNNFWLQRSKEAIRERVASKSNTKVAKNVILFVGDGMGLTTIAAARNLLGGEEQQMSFETFPTVGLAKTYSVDKIVPDSACAATAFLGGVKTNHGTIGFDGGVQRSDCNKASQEGRQVHSIAKWALDAGKAAGFVTTSSVTHATPAALYAHATDRDWENDTPLRAKCGDKTELKDIAQQLILGAVGSKLKVVLGGGKSHFLSTSMNGSRTDGLNLIDEYAKQSPDGVFVETLSELQRADPAKSKRLFGLFHTSSMNFNLDAQGNGTTEEPTLEEMTRKALEFMSNEEQGYFLLIETGRIDTAHHATNARLALDETVEFSKAVELAHNMTNKDDTLIVVTADHSHTFSLAGYQLRGSDVFDITPLVADDDQTYLALSYANGPSFEEYYNTKKNSRRNPRKVLKDENNDVFPATVPLSRETHGGEDVPVYATGPWSQLFSGVYEQNVLAHLMAYAACLGNGLKACSSANSNA